MNRLLMDRSLLGALVVTALALVAAGPAQAADCPACGMLQKNCTAGCLGVEDKRVIPCLLACDNAVAACSCDDPVTLRSEDAVRLGLAGGPRQSGSAFKAAACHSTTACGPSYPSCASWSGYSDCDDPWCGIYKFCGDPPFCEEPDICFGPALRQNQERFRVCFNSLGQPCTEYQRINFVLGCGC